MRELNIDGDAQADLDGYRGERAIFVYQIVWNGMNVTTGICKDPIKDRVAVRTLNLDGDRQANLKVHGGADKAVDSYPVEHYDYWRSELLGRELSLGVFGEDFTIDDLFEGAVNIRDRFSIGSRSVLRKLWPGGASAG